MYSLLAQQVRSPAHSFRSDPRSVFIFFKPMRVCTDGDAAVLAGTGKSLLLRAIIMALKKKHSNNPEVVSVTASTGMAASNIGGTVSIGSPIVGIGGPRYLILYHPP